MVPGRQRKTYGFKPPLRWRAWGPGYVEAWGSENRREATPLGQELPTLGWLQEVGRVNSWSFLFSLWTRRCLQERIERIEKATRGNVSQLIIEKRPLCSVRAHLLGGNPVFVSSGDSQGRELIPGNAQTLNMGKVESWVDLSLGFLQVGLVLFKVKIKQLWPKDPNTQWLT